MSSFLSAVARTVPKAVGSTAGTGIGPRTARTRVVRMLSAGLCRNGKDCPLTGPPVSALATREVAVKRTAPGLVHLQQQRRLLSIQSDDLDKDVAAPEVAVDDSVEEVGQEAEGGAAEETVVETETRTAGGSPHSVFLVQMDGIPFAMSQADIEAWLAEAGSSPQKVTVPLWPEGSMRAGQNKGRAYLEFSSEEETQAGLALSGRAVGDRWINISRLSMPLEETCVVTVKGLAGVAEDDLHAILEETVGVAPLTVNIIENINRPRPLAFATFETPEQARAAVVLDGTKVRDMWVDVSIHVAKENFRDFVGNKKQSPFGPDVPDELIVMLAGLPFSLAGDEIKAYLANHVDAEDIIAMRVPKYNDTQFNTGVAMFHLRTVEAVSSALKLKGTYIGDRWVDVSRWNERSSPKQKATHKSVLEENRRKVPAALREKHPNLPVVAVSGIPFDKTETEVIEFFEANGVPRSAMADVEMPRFLQTERNTGCCWLVIDDENAYGTLMELNGAAMDERWVTINDA